MTATVSEKRRSGSLDNTSGSDKDEKVLKQTDSLADEIQAPKPELEEAAAHARTMSPEEVEQMIDHLLNEHARDPLFTPNVIEAAERYRFDEELKNDPVEYQRVYEELKIEAALLVINSPYSEVRAVVDNHDDPTLPANTFRVWLIGTIFAAAGALINQFFTVRQPGITFSANVAQMLAFPAGKLLEVALPSRRFTTFGYTWSLNPGRFNLKEHTMITVMANAGLSAPLYSFIIPVQFLPIYFNQAFASKFGYQMLVALSSNYLGYGLAGLTRRFLVYPSQAVWPASLATVALNRAFHTETNNVVNGWAISRMRWFAYCFIAMFIYFWFPNYIVQAMSYFNWMTWIAPENAKLGAITGSVSGLGLNPLPTFDWNQIVVITDPLISPFFTMINIFLGAALTLPIIIAIWFSNTWYTSHLPVNSNRVFDNTGKIYEISRIVNDKTLFDEAAYKAYSPAYFSPGSMVIYGANFGACTSIITHAALHHRREIVSGFKNLISRKPAFSNSKDIHTRLMKPYREVPEWVYLAVLCAAVGIGAAGIAAYPTHTSPIAVLYGLILAAIFCVPCGIIKATTNVEVPLNILSELFGGLLFPGNANGMNFFKVYGFVTTTQTLRFAQDLKLAHYSHISPWITFNCQMFAILVSSFVCTAILNYQMTDIPDVCISYQNDHFKFTCPNINTAFTTSVLWGTLGPERMFGAGALYNGLLWFFLVGAILPIAFHFLSKKWKVFQHLHAPVFLFGGFSWAPYDFANVWPAVPVAWLFNYYLKRRFLGWWSKYNYVTSSAFSCAIALSALVTYFALQQQGIEILWSGNTRPYSGCDGTGCALHPIPTGSHFGPGPGEF